jgi:diaminopimelate epimerase
MCGNGVRCVAKYVYDHGIVRRPTLNIETGQGVLALQLEVVDDRVVRVRVDMGRPILEAAKIPVALPGMDGAQRIVNVALDGHLVLAGPGQWWDACDLDRRMTCISMGNPHLVLYCKHVDAVPLEAIGPAWERAPIFPKRTNVHFVEVQLPGEVIMRTWERGSGRTLACGTGAAAVCVAGVLTGRTQRAILAHLPGGDLELLWGQDDRVLMTGPATEVFSGDWPL